MANDLEKLVKATSSLTRRAGGSQFRLLNKPGSTRWIAVADFGELGVRTGDGYSPYIACLSLATELLDGTTCRRCNHVISVSGNDENFCQWRYRDGDFRSGCGAPVDTNIAMLPGQV